MPFQGREATLPALLPDGTRITGFKFPSHKGPGSAKPVVIRFVESGSTSEHTVLVRRRRAFQAFVARNIRYRFLAAGPRSGPIASVGVSEAVFYDATGAPAFVLLATKGTKPRVMFLPPRR